MYDVYRTPATARQIHLTITLNGSKSLLNNPHAPPISFQVTCDPPPTQPVQPNNPTFSKVKVFREMYKSASKCCPVLESLSGGDCSQTLLRLNEEGDNNCRTLLCEISFHLFRWQAVGVTLGMEQLDVDAIKEEHEGKDFYIPAFKLLTDWVSRSDSAPNLETLIEGLRCCGYVVRMMDWSTSYNTIVPRSMNRNLMLKVAERIQCHWRFVGRLLGMLEVDIDCIAQSPSSLWDQADTMLCRWQKQSPLAPEDAYVELFKSVHCVSEHISKPYLKAAVKLLE